MGTTAASSGGLPQRRQTAAAKAQRRLDLISELSTIDAKAIRPLRSIAAGSATQADRDALAALEARAAEVREALA